MAGKADYEKSDEELDLELEQELAELNRVKAKLAAETAKLNDLIAATAALGPLGAEILAEYEAEVARMGL